MARPWTVRLASIPLDRTKKSFLLRGMFVFESLMGSLGFSRLPSIGFYTILPLNPFSFSYDKAISW